MGFFVRNYLEESIIRHAFHGFFLNKGTHEIDIVFQLDKNDSYICTDDEFRMVSEKYTGSGKQRILGAHKNHLSLFEIEKGNIITFIGAYGYALKIVNVGKNCFMCISDNTKVLRCGDILTSIGLGFGEGHKVLFSVKRNGHYYPSEKMLFRTPMIRSIYYLQDTHLDYMGQMPETEVKTIQRLYASCFEFRNNSAYISELNLTTEESLIFNIDLEKGTFSLNKSFRRDIYEKAGVNIIDDILRPVSFVKGSDINNVKELQDGTFRYDPKRRILKVESLMSIVLGN